MVGQPEEGRVGVGQDRVAGQPLHLVVHVLLRVVVVELVGAVAVVQVGRDGEPALLGEKAAQPADPFRDTTGLMQDDEPAAQNGVRFGGGEPELGAIGERKRLGPGLDHAQQVITSR